MDKASLYQSGRVAYYELARRRSLGEPRFEHREMRDAWISQHAEHIGIRVENGAVVGVAGVGVFRYHGGNWTDMESFPEAIIEHTCQTIGELYGNS